MTPADFWTNNANHVAVNPHRPQEATGLAEFAESQGWQGWCFFQTSGSEGTPKWVALTKEAFLISARAVNAHFAVSAADRWLIALPLHHVGGFAILARAELSGSSMVRDESRWEPCEFTALCEREEITLVSLVPAQVHDLVREKLHAPSRLRAAIIGGGGMSPELATAARALGWPVFQSYGMTEAGSQIATQPYSVEAMFGRLEILQHWQTRIDEDERLVLIGPALAKGYAVRETAGDWRWQPITDELVTRDHVRLWEEGGRRWLAFVGRESGFVKILGELIHLAPLQARLEALAVAHGLKVPVIAALPDARRDSRFVLVVESEAEAALREAFNAVTEPLCQLSEIVRVSVIPRTSLGKVDAAALKALLPIS
jgi:O-succinylbenzoic acid--CoA ligase